MTITHATRVLTDVTNIEFSVLHVAIQNTTIAEVRYIVKYMWYSRVNLVHCTSAVRALRKPFHSGSNTSVM